jgi:hypothetical protein
MILRGGTADYCTQPGPGTNKNVPRYKKNVLQYKPNNVPRSQQKNVPSTVKKKLSKTLYL